MLARETIAEQIAGWAARLRFDDLPLEVEERIRLLILDHVAVTLGGIRHQATRPVLDTVAPEGSGNASGVPVWGAGRTARLEDTVLVHATAASALDFDDVHLGAGIHPGATCLPVILGIAMERRIPLSEVIAAAAVAYETMVRVGMAVFPASRDHGFHATPVMGSIGAAVGAARLLGLPAAALADAISLAAMNAGGLFAYHGSWIEPSRVQIGRVAREGLLCARLAGNGTAGPRDVFENRDGFLNAFSGSIDRNRMTDGLGSDWHLMMTEPKLYPFCKQTYGAIEAAMKLRRRQATLHAIRSITVETTHSAAALPSSYPQNADAAVLSLRYAISSTLHLGTPGMRHLSEDVLADPGVADLFHRIQVIGSPDLSRRFPPQTPASIVTTLTDGTLLHASADGDGVLQDQSLEADGLARKFTELAVPVIGDVISQQLWVTGRTTTDQAFADLLETLQHPLSASTGLVSR